MQRKDQGGYLISIMLWVLTGLVTLSAVSFSRALTDMSVAGRLASMQQALHLAESGVDAALRELKTNPFRSLSNPYTCPGSCSQSMQNVTWTLSLGPTVASRLLQATGTAGGITQSIEVIAELSGNLLFWWPLFGINEVRVDNDGDWPRLIDSYDSSLGSYAATKLQNPAAAQEISVQTNGIIEGAITKLGGPFDFWSNLIVGSGADPSNLNFYIQLFGPSNVFGAKQVAAANVVFPPVVPPAGSSGLGTIGECNSTFMVAGTVSRFRIDVPPNCTITLSGGGIVHVDWMDIGNNSELRIQGNIQLVVYRDVMFGDNESRVRVDTNSSGIFYLMSQVGGIGVERGFFVNDTKIPANMQLYIPVEDGFLVNGWWNDELNRGEFWGAVFAPNAELNLQQDTEFYGSFIGLGAHVHENTSVHYDRALRNLAGPGSGIQLRSWRQP